MLTMLLVALAAVLAAVYYLILRRFDYWRQRKVPHVKPLTIFGNYADAILVKKHMAYVIEDLSKNFQNEPYYGSFYGTEPTLVVKDPELVKLITTKDFYYCHGREISDYMHHEEFNKNLSFASGDYWRVLRQNLTPVFTSAKMKNMFPLIEDCSVEFENMLDAEADTIDDDFKIQPLASRFTIFCIASCAFGIDSGTMSKDYENNILIKIAHASTNPSKLGMLMYFIRIVWPSVFYRLGLKLISESMYDTIRKFVVPIYKSRNYKASMRKDFIDFVLDFKQKTYITGDKISNLKTGRKEKVQLPVTDDLMVSQSLLFYIAGFETSATTISFTMYVLAKYPEIQEKVQAEVDAYLQKHDNKLTYDIVTELPYTWACVEETLRLYPIASYISREVIESYTLPTGLTLEKGVRIHIAVQEMHRNPKYFPEPEIIRPERFLGEEKQKIIPYSFLPFGEGSRICIGMRFAKMQVLAGIVTIMKKYTLEMTEKTLSDIVFSPKIAMPCPEAPLSFKAVPRPGWETRTFKRCKNNNLL